MAKDLSQKEAFAIASSYQFDTESIQLGPWTSYSLLNDPKHMCFVLARYKFCAKMLQGKKNILEIGCGDGFGIPIIAQDAEYVLGIDVDDRLIDGNSGRLEKIKNIEFKKIDICQAVPERKFDAVFSIDVIEHLDAPLEKPFMDNTCQCLKDDGICIIGSPNKTSEKYATERSRIQHINLKTAETLRELLNKYFVNSFIFSMNDEVIHTGYYPMAHYLFGIGVGKK
ncbi:MAG: class I SAM-dependent methyltransferase [Sedimentisphaerales bacterium]|nr:class I SAM-dependent methyltransferase [Sedimentisphaerales bacterium]